MVRAGRLAVPLASLVVVIALLPSFAGAGLPGHAAPPGILERLSPTPTGLAPPSVTSLLPLTSPPAPPNPGAIPSAASGSSDVVETTPIVIPTTTPSVFTIASNLNCPPSAGCSPELNVTAPAGPWALILLNYTGVGVPSIYDSSFHATVNNIPVLFGTTPEEATWTVLKNLTEYSALFHQTAVVQFDLGDAVITGHFVISVSIAFYPVAAGSLAPRVPNAIVPLWPFTTVSNTRPIVSVNATVPRDTENATLEVYSYGFSDSGHDEFWYEGVPAYRAVNVTVDGGNLARIQPFEYVNTGGLSDPYLWDPVTAAYTVNDPPYEVDVTAALGLIEGSHTFNATILDRASGSGWYVAGSLLLYTNTSYIHALLVSDPLPVGSATMGTSNGVTTETVTDAYSYASTLDTDSGAVTAASWTNESFVASFPTNSVVVNALTSFQERIVTPSATETIDQTSAPALEYQATTIFVPSSNKTGYPINGTQTFTMVNLHQNWNLTSVEVTQPDGGPSVTVVVDSNDNVTANGSYVAQVEYTSPSAEQTLSISTCWSNTTKVFRTFDEVGNLTSSYSRLLVSAFVPADLTSDMATVTTNQQAVTNGVSVSESRSQVDAGQPELLTASPFGFGAPFSYRWSGLPNGCTTAGSGASVNCVVAVPGTYTAGVQLTNSFGTHTGLSSVQFTVLKLLVGKVSAAPPEIDLGGTTNLGLVVTGGQAPYTCSWTEDGSAIAVGSMCPLFVAFSPRLTGSIVIVATISDAFGTVANATLNLTVVRSATVALATSAPSATTVPQVTLGGSLNLTATLSGGVAPYVYTWTVGTASVHSTTSNANESNYTYHPTTLGNVTIAVSVTDADNQTSESPGFVVDVLPSGSNPPPSNNGTTTPSGSLNGTDALVGVGLAGAVIVVMLILLTTRRPKAPPPSEPPQE